MQDSAITEQDFDLNYSAMSQSARGAACDLGCIASGRLKDTGNYSSVSMFCHGLDAQMYNSTENEFK